MASISQDKGKQAREGGVPSGEALDVALNELEKKLDRVRSLYEQYFAGIEKMEPLVARKEVTRTLIIFAQHHIRNTGQRFRFHSLQQKWNIHITYWNRTMREIEAGTYRRDVARVTRKLTRQGAAISDELAHELKIKRPLAQGGADGRATATDSSAVATPQAAGPAPSAPRPPSAVPAEAQASSPGDRDFAEAAMAAFDSVFGDSSSPPPPSRPPAMTPAVLHRPQVLTPAGSMRAPNATPPSIARPAPGARRASPSGMSEDQLKALHRQYVSARKQAGDASADGIKYEAIVATVAKQAPAIIEKYKCASVDFTVVIKDSKVILKAIPKK